MLCVGEHVLLELTMPFDVVVLQVFFPSFSGLEHNHTKCFCGEALKLEMQRSFLHREVIITYCTGGKRRGSCFVFR